MATSKLHHIFIQCSSQHIYMLSKISHHTCLHREIWKMHNTSQNSKKKQRWRIWRWWCIVGGTQRGGRVAAAASCGRLHLLLDGRHELVVSLAPGVLHLQAPQVGGKRLLYRLQQREPCHLHRYQQAHGQARLNQDFLVPLVSIWRMSTTQSRRLARLHCFLYISLSSQSQVRN